MEQTAVKLYSYNFEKPELSDETLEHFGVKGMHWGVRKDGKPQGYQGTGRGRKKSSTKKPVTKKQKRKAREHEIKNKSKEDIIKDKDIEAMSKRKSEFSNQEINDVLNRIGTEQRLDQMAKQTNPSTKDKIKKVINSKEFKIAAGIAVAVLPIAIYAASTTSRNRNMKLGPATSSFVTKSAGSKIGKNIYDNPYLKAYTSPSGSKGSKVMNNVGGFIMYDPPKGGKGIQKPDTDRAARAMAKLIFGVDLPKKR